MKNRVDSSFYKPSNKELPKWLIGVGFSPRIAHNLSLEHAWHIYHTYLDWYCTEKVTKQARLKFIKDLEYALS